MWPGEKIIKKLMIGLSKKFKLIITKSDVICNFEYFHLHRAIWIFTVML